jgi:Predicted membrane protein
MDSKWLLVLTYSLAALIEIGLPVTLALIVVRRFKVAWAVVLTGVLTFIGSQVVHIPLLQIPVLLQKLGVAVTLPQYWPVWAYALYLGLFAGLCEETARLVGFKILKRKSKAEDFKGGMALGIGHGGVESVIIGGVVLTSLIVALVYSNIPQTATGAAAEAAKSVQAQMAAFWSTPWHLPFAGAVERITAISSHLLMTMLVWKTVMRGKAWGYPLAVLYHTALDGVSVWLSTLGLSAWQLEGCLAVFMLLSLFLLWRIWVSEKASASTPAPDSTTGPEPANAA